MALPLLPIGVLLVRATIRYLPGTVGEKAVEGLKVSRPVELIGIVVAAPASPSVGAVVELRSSGALSTGP